MRVGGDTTKACVIDESNRNISEGLDDECVPHTCSLDVAVHIPHEWTTSFEINSILEVLSSGFCLPVDYLYDLSKVDARPMQIRRNEVLVLGVQ